MLNESFVLESVFESQLYDAPKRDIQRQISTAGGITPVSVVASRLGERLALQDYYRKVYDLRKLVAGDFSPLMMGPQARTDQPQSESVRISEFYDFIVTDFIEGRSNELLRAVKEILMAIAFRLPEFEFEDLSSLLAAFHTSYLKTTFGHPPLGCAANDETRIALLDYIISGMGWVFTVYKDPRMAVQACDTLDMVWDRGMKVPSKGRWASCRWRDTVSYWKSVFPNYEWETNTDLVDDESVMELEFYYDTDGGDEGSHYVLRSTGPQSVDEVKVIHQGPNPWFYDQGGKKVPFVPYSPVYFVALPSVRNPIGIVEQMLPNQISIWESEDTLRSYSKRGKAGYQVKPNSVDRDNLEKFYKGLTGGLIETNDEIRPLPGLNASATEMEWLSLNKNSIQSHKGTNPYVSGAPPTGIKYSSEVHEIAAQADMLSGFVASDYSLLWIELARKTLAGAVAYDQSYHVVNFDGARMEFDAFKPISRFLVPEADMVIREDDTAFIPRRQRILEAAEELTQALAVQTIFPNATKLAYEQYLRATGKTNPAPWLEPPALAPAPPTDPEADDPSASAASSNV